MEGLYHNNSNIYSSSSPYMMSHPDHSSYYSPTSSLPCRNNNNSAFSDARPCPSYISTSSSHPESSSSTTTPTSTNAPNWTSPTSPPTNGYSWPNSTYPPPYPYHHHRPFSSSTSCYPLPTHTPIQRPKLTTTVWEDEGTVCYQVDAKSVCVARRQDNDMINGTKLLNVVGMSRGKRDGILKNEKGRVVVKVGAMHLKGVWITFERAKDLAAKFKITDLLYPLFTDDPSVFLCPSSNGNTMLPPPTTTQNTTPMMVPSTRPYQYKQQDSSTYGFPMASWDRSESTNHDSFASILRNDQTNLPSGSCSPVPGTMAPPPSNDNDIYLMNSPYDNSRHPYRQNHYDNNSPYDYDTFSRKPMIKPPSHLSAYPHSPPQESGKPSRKRSLPSSTSPPPPLADKRTLKRLRNLDN
ncbi:hypothetical protein BC941DRAFT_464201 [Chlamydoabsidia padenii]|nr:hypothetical protein BC941DRAFT_464201 [Chlamydoabsidia padenii]